MKKGRFLWSAHRITKKQKAGKARNIKEKQLKNSRSTASKPPGVRLSSASADIILRAEGASFSTRSPKPSGFGLLSLYLGKKLSPMKLKQELFFQCKDLLSGTIRSMETGADRQREPSAEAWRGN